MNMDKIVNISSTFKTLIIASAVVAMDAHVIEDLRPK